MEFYGHFDKMAGCRAEAFQVEDATVASLLAEMVRRLPRRFMDTVLDRKSGEFSLAVLVLVNDIPVYHRDGMKTELKDGDRVIFLPPMAGGMPG